MNILVVGPSWVGDMVMAQSLFMALKTRYADVAIDVLAPAWSRPILEAMPEVRATIDMPVGHGALQLGGRYRLAQSLKEQAYDQAIVLPNSLKSALIPWMAGIPLRTGWKGEMRYGLLNDLRPLDKNVFSLMVQKYVGLAYPKGTVPSEFQCPQPGLRPRQRFIDEALESFGLNTAARILALCPGAEFGRAKKWPERHYAEIARRHVAQGGQVWLFGSQNDVPACAQIAEAVSSDRLQVLAGQTSLQQAVALMSMVHAVVANDSGLMHVAAALQRPLVALFGSTSPDYTPPLSDHCRVIKATIECSPCFKRECPYGHYRCLEEMMPDQIWQALKQLEVTGAKS
ncbi:MAG: lipopolysaccharide heptosyltransferase II [Oleiphilus sp.]|nr:MAG: lipopolysaccharide heptosyltransferase II [Oleiphilus sp.]